MIITDVYNSAMDMKPVCCLSHSHY